MGNVTNSQSPNFPTRQSTLPAIPQTTRFYLILALLLPIFAIAPLFYPGYFQSHSGLVPLWNVIELRQSLGDFSWLPHIATNFDPLRSDGLLPYYGAALLPLPPVVAVKLVMGGAWLAGSLGMFLWLRSWLGSPGALIAALVYTYLPYQIVTVYVRGAWGETLFLGLLPWVILATTYLVTSPKWPLVPLAAFFWLLLGLSQLGLTLWAFFFLVLLLLVVHRPQALLPILSAAIGTGLVTVVTLLRAAPTSQKTPFQDHFLYPFQLFSAYWGWGVSTSDWADGLSLQLGLAALGLSFLTLILWQRSASRPEFISRTDRRLLFFGGATLILIFGQLGALPFLWNIPFWPGYTLADTLTYPWQLLGLTGLCLAVFAGAAPWLDQQLRQLPLFAAVIIIVILSSYAYLLPQFIQGDNHTTGPQAELGDAQLVLLEADFTVASSGQTAGLARGSFAVPLSLHGPPQAGDTLQLEVVWQPLRSFAEDMKVFVHLVDRNDNVLVQFDGQPQQGIYPTSQWIPGELIMDSYPLPLPAELPSGPYRAFIGLYDEATFARLPVSADSDGRVILNVE